MSRSRLAQAAIGNPAMAVIVATYVVWALALITRSSFVAMDGQRYFGLVDDAMISMRYAWNFSHGNGLVWNIGERVEGYTNLLMVLLMSAATLVFHRSSAVLFIQLSGIPVTLGVAWFAVRIFRLARSEFPGAHERFLTAAVFVAVLAYYPLSFWSLFGMETGLLALLITAAVSCSLSYLGRDEPALALSAGVTLGLAFLARNDSLIFAVLLFAYLAVALRAAKRTTRWWILAGAIYLVFVAAQEAFRYNYYGAWVPNTFTLKLTGTSLWDRLRNGSGFIAPFLPQSAVIVLIGLLGARAYRPKYAGVLLSFLVCAFLYQIYVGGDPWNRWRMLAPVMPLALVVFVHGCAAISVWFSSASAPALRRPAASILLVAGLLGADVAWMPEILLTRRAGSEIIGIEHVNTAIAINAVTRPTATIGVISAGIVPYYTDRKAIDFLGKSDPYIANLAPDMSGAVSWNGMYSVPGHNKYDLNYSIVQLRPTWIEYHAWGSQDLSDWLKDHYIAVRYKSVRLRLLLDSPDVHWDRVRYLEPQVTAEESTILP